ALLHCPRGEVRTHHDEGGSMDGITNVPQPANEPVNSYAPGTPERARLQAKLAELEAHPTEIHHVIGGEHRRSATTVTDVVQPHKHASVLGTFTHATPQDVRDAVEAANEAAPAWRAMSF